MGADPQPHADRRAHPRRRAASSAAPGSCRWSHERFDGTGYPDGLAGEEIPLGWRIILVADAFDAMVSERSYGEVLTEADALAELRRCAGTQFDPAVVAAFERVLEQILV